MGNYIKYRRIVKIFERKLDFLDQKTLIQEWFDKLVTDGYDIIHYQEEESDSRLRIIVIVGKPRIS